MEHSPLNRLPSELRNYIYELALVQPDGVWIGCWGGHRPCRPGEKLKAKATAARGLALTRTCKQIHAEATEVCYNGNDFTIAMAPVGLKQSRDICAIMTMMPLQKFLSTIGTENEQALRSITLVLLSNGDFKSDVSRPPMSKVIKLMLLNMRVMTERNARVDVNISLDFESPRYGPASLLTASIDVKDGIACIETLLAKLEIGKQFPNMSVDEHKSWTRDARNALEDWMEAFRK